MGLLKAALMGIGSRPSPSGLGRSPYARRTDASSRARRHVRWWPEQAQRHRLKVLHDGGKVELVACAGETAQPQSLEAVVGLQVRKAHLHALTLIAGSGEGFRRHLSPGDVASVLADVAHDAAGRACWDSTSP